ncbi:hypothetical protein MLD38_002024 [Melastoma candidum]|uniref:Uncharacterized protein n=1 Tax=Melastoma candidum TaxID=119954 RepID=A0ACB9SF12_9MYRT|nr:hypothetical protein MLD38_002024 [Melastoma candidum]
MQMGTVEEIMGGSRGDRLSMEEGRRGRLRCKPWGVLAFVLVGATPTTLAVMRPRQSVDWVYYQEEGSLEETQQADA